MKRSNTSSRQLRRSRKGLAVAAAALLSAVAAGTASAQLVYDPFNYGTANQGKPVASVGGGQINPMTGQPWLEVNASYQALNGLGTALSPANFQNNITVGSLPQVTGLDAFTGDSISHTNGTAPNYARSIRTSFSQPGIAAGTINYSFALKISDLAGLSSSATNPAILACFNNTFGLSVINPTTMGTRLVAKLNSGDATKYDIGLMANSTSFNTSTIQWDPTPHSTTETLFVVGSYDRTANTDKLYINPDPSSFGAATAPTTGTILNTSTGTAVAVTAFVLRDDAVAANPGPRGVQIDELRIDSSWSQVTAPTGTTFSNANANTNWSDAGNWSSGAPSAAGNFAYFKGGGSGTVNLDANQTAGTLTFRTATPQTIAAGGGTLTLDNGAGAAGTAYINVQPAPNATTGAPQAVTHTIAAPVTLTGNLNVNAGVGQTLTMSGTISGAGKTVTKNGAGTLLISGGNNATVGSAAVSGGLLRFADAASYANVGAITVPGSAAAGALGAVGADSGSLDAGFIAKIVAGSVNSFGAIALSAADANTAANFTVGTGNGGLQNAKTASMSLGANGDVTYNGTITVANNGTYRLGGGTGTLTVTSNLPAVGTNPVSITNGGVVKLRGTNSTTGVMTITNGTTLNIDSVARLGPTQTPASVVINNGTLQWDADFQLTSGFTIGSGGAILDTNGHNTTNANPNLDQTAGSIFSVGAGVSFPLTKAGAGEFYTGAQVNEFYDPLTLKGGTFYIFNESQIGSNAAASTVNFDGGALRLRTGFTMTGVHTAVVTGNGGTLMINNGQTVHWNGTFNGTGTLTVGTAATVEGQVGTGTLIPDTDSPNFAGTWRITAGSLAGLSDAKFGPTSVPIWLDGGFLTVVPGNSTSLSHPIIAAETGNTGTVLVDGSDVLTLTGPITGGGAFAKESNNNGGTVVLAGVSKTYGGATVASHGTLQIASGANDMLPVGNDVTTVGSSAVLDLQDTTQHVGNVTLQRGQIIGAGGGKLVATGTFNVQNGNISAILDGASAPLVKSTGNTVTLSGVNTYGGGTTVSAGTLIAANADALAGGSVNVADGALAQAMGGLTKAVTVTTLNTNTTGKFDLTNNSMVVKGMADSAVRTLLQSGYNAGAWNGPTGIVSSSITAETSIGYATQAQTGITNFKGVTGLAGTDVLVKFTFAGDANLDGKVDIGDLGLLAGAWQAASGKVWFDGDFTYDGAVDIGDLGLLSGNWQKGTAGNPNPPLMDFATAMAQFSAFDGVVVPEPASLALLALGGIGLLGRRRRHRLPPYC